LNTTYGDPKIKSAIQAHRAPGFQNRKPKHRRDDGTCPSVVLHRAERVECDKAREELKGFVEAIEQRRQAAAKESLAYRERLKSSGMDAGGNPGAAYQIHARDIIAHFGGAVNFSQVDSMAAVRMRVTGYTREQVEEAIRDNAALIRPENRRESHNWEEYATRTTSYAYENPKANDEVDALSRKRGAWMALEGRRPPKEKERVKSMTR
jgi:hypothetical protein